MNIKLIYSGYKNITDKTGDFVLLFVRFLLAYGFYHPALLKLRDINSVGQWFEGMNYPLPYLNAYLATGTEVAGVFLLFLGLGTRIITVPLIITMLVAITTVHWGNGFDAGNNGSEIPLYYIAMLLVLLANGAGKISLDRLFRK